MSLRSRHRRQSRSASRTRTRQLRAPATIDAVHATTSDAPIQCVFKTGRGCLGHYPTLTIDLTPNKPAAAAKSDGKTQAFKPVTGDDKTNTKKKSREF